MKNYHDKTKPQMIEEIESLKKRIEELEQSEFKYKQTEKILRANEIKLRSIIEHSSNLFYSHTPDHVITYLSPQSKKFFDCEPDEARIRWTEFLTENSINEIGFNLTNKAIETGEVQPSYELELVGKKGRKLWVEVDEAPVVEHRQTVAIVGALTDITERKHAEKALKESELRYRRLFEDSPAALWEEDFSEVMTYISEKRKQGVSDFKEYFNDNPDEVKKCVRMVKVINVNKAGLKLHQAKTIQELLGNLDKSLNEQTLVIIKKELIALAEGKTHFESEAEMITVKGDFKYIFLRLYVGETDKGENDYSSVLLAINDITNRKQAESQLIESKRMLNDVLNTIPVRVFWKDLDGVYLGCNQIFAKDAGRSNPEEMIGDNDYNMGWAEQADLYRSDDRVVIESGQPKINYEEPQTTPEGKTIWLNTSKIPLLNSTGAVYGVLGTYEDITERKQAEKDLFENRELYRVLIESAPYGIAVINEYGEILISNNKLVKISGYNKDEIPDIQMWFKKVYSDEEYWKDVIKLYSEPVKEGDSQVREAEIIRKDGQKCLCQFVITLLPSGSMIVFVSDITERKQAELALLESRENLSIIYDTVVEVLFQLSVEPDDVFRFLSVNKRFFETTGTTEDKIIGKRYDEVFPESKHQLVLSKYKEAIRDKKTVHWEESSVYPAGELSGIVSISPFFDSKGICKYLIGSIYDITDRKRAEEELQTSEEKYRTLFESIPDVITTIDSENKIISANNSVKRILGYEPTELIGKQVSILAPAELRLEQSENIKKAITNGVLVGVETIRLSKDGTRIPVDISLFASRDTTGELLGLSAIMRDIKESKNAEKALRESEKNLSLIYDTVDDVIFQLSVEPENCFRFFSVNKRFLETTGLTAVQIIHKRYDEVIPEPLCDMVLENYKQAIREKKTIRWEETANYPTGELTGIVSVSPFFDDQGECKYLIGSVHNITERKIAEDKLKQSEESYRGLFNNATDSIYIQDTEGRFLDVNEGAIKLYGYTREEFIGKTPEFLTAPGKNDLREVAECIEKAFKGEPQQFEFWGLRSNGEAFPKIVRLQKGKYFGKEVIIAFAIDITDRKQAEEELLKSEYFLSEAQRVAHLGSYEFDIASGFWTSSDELDRIFGINENFNRNIEAWNNVLHPEDREAMLAYFQDDVLTAHRNFNREYRITRINDSELRWVHGLGELEFDDEGNPVRMIGTIQDITERKMAEEEIRKLSHSVEQSPAIVTITDSSGNIEYVNPKFEEVTGYTINEVIGKNPRILKAGVTTLEEYETLWKTIKMGGVWRGEFHNKKKNGELYWESATISGIKNSSGKITHFVAVKEDITERKEAEEALQESEAKWRSLTENSPDHIMLLDKYANILFVNRTVPGQIKEEVVGKPVYNFVPPEYHDTAKEHFKSVVTSGSNESYETKYLSEDGNPQFFSVRIAPVFREGKIVGMVTSSTNITEQKLAEKRIKESRNRMQSLAERLQMIREEERATIAREIHDDLGQSLTALKMDISWMKNSPEMDAETKADKFDTMLNLTNSTIQTVKRIATKLRPGILDDLGLVPAIEWQAAEFQNRYKVQCNLSINKSDVIIKDEISIAVFRIFQETLTNIARHSGATKADINLDFYDDSKLIMEIADNGVGIDEEQINSPKSLGLFGMRERVNILKGEMEIVGEHGKGTTVKVTMPF